MFCWGYYIKEHKSHTGVFILESLKCDGCPWEMSTCSSGLKHSHSPMFTLTLKIKIKGGELSILLARAGLPGAGAFTCLSVWSRWTGLHPPKSYLKLCLLFLDSCHALPKFMKTGWKAVRSTLVGSRLVLLLHRLPSRGNFSRCLGILLFYFI